MSWTLCLSGPAIFKAGANVSSTAVDYTANRIEIDAWSDEAEGSIELETGKAFIDNFSELPTGIQGALNDVCTSKIAMKMISYDITGYLSREADTLLNVHNDIIFKGLAKLKEFTKLSLKKPPT